MQPDQNKPQGPNDSAAPPDPSQQPLQPQTPVSPVAQPPTLDQQPVAGQVAQPEPTPASQDNLGPSTQQPVEPSTSTGIPQQSAGVVQPPQQSTDPSQLGYVPPTNAGMNNIGQPTTLPKDSFFSSKKFRILIVVIIAVFSFTGIGILAKDTLFSGSNIKTSDLVEESANGVNFQRPKQWSKTEGKDYDVVFTEKGQPIDDSDQGMGVINENIGVDFETLTEDQKQQFNKALEEQFTDPNKFTGDGCDEVNKSEVNKVEHKNYPLAYKIEITCNKITGRNIKGVMVGMLGIKEKNMDIVVIVAVDKTWDKSSEAFNEILNNFSHQ